MSNLATTSNLIEKLKPQMLKALPKHITADRMARVALTELRKIPKLQLCDPTSFCGALMACAQLGLEPGGALGYIYLIPFKREVQVILGYRGMIELARRSGQVVSLSAHEVFENDFFEFEYGLEEKLRHKPALGNRGPFIAVYAIAHLVGGGHQIEVMSKQDVDKIRTRSKAASSGPWATDYEEMSKKTVLRKLFKYLPVSIEMQNATSLDEQADIGSQDFSDALGDDFEIDIETGEILDEKSNQIDEIEKELGAK